MIIGHRGASVLAPENTVAAFERALDDAADGIELDVRLAKDGVPVVIHDGTLQRTGLMSGEVAQMTSQELADIHVGAWFNRANPALAQAEYEKQKVPTLRDVLHRFEQCAVYVELKTDSAPTVNDLVQTVIDTILETDSQERVVVVSFDHTAIQTIKSLNSSVRTGALFEPRRRPGLSWRAEAMLNAAADCGADEILPHRLLARPKLIEKARDRNLPVVVWTVDDPSWLARAKNLGIRGLITNNPARMVVA